MHCEYRAAKLLMSIRLSRNSFFDKGIEYSYINYSNPRLFDYIPMYLLEALVIAESKLLHVKEQR